MEAEEPKASSTTDPETLNSETEPNQPSTRHPDSQEEEENNRRDESKASSFDQKEILRALEMVERDSLAIGESFTSLFASLRLALSEVTGTSVDHMHCFSDAAGCLQECALDATTKGNRYINSCLRLNEEMKGIDSLAVQLKILRRNVDALDSGVNRILRLP
uniref:BLOC-1-related complex subunit 6 C-terminal helix domain-containing protein n=1 Tax=Davidia involucrata TaxID=16924 RepID=A0A5B7ANE6_DAVIN